MIEMSEGYSRSLIRARNEKIKDLIFRRNLSTEGKIMKVQFKYMEPEILADIADYVASTYGAHYVGEDNVQALDLIAANNLLHGFATGSIIKYASRYGKKKGFNEADLLKVIHYAMFLLWEKRKNERKSNPLDDSQFDETSTTSEK